MSNFVEGYIRYRLGLYETYLIMLIGEESHLFYQLGYSTHSSELAKMIRLANE